MDNFLEASFSGLMLGGVYALLALGVVMVYKSTKVFNIAHGEIMMFLAYLMWFLFKSHDFPLWTAVLLVLVAGVVIGLICERVFLRPLIGKPMLITFLVCLVLGVFIRSITILWHGGAPQVVRGVFPSGNMDLGSISVSIALVWSFVIALALFSLCALFFRFTRHGLEMRSVAEDHHISHSMGLDVEKTFAMAWAIGCILAAVSGILIASRSVVAPDMGMSVLIKALPVLLLGGMESLLGALIAGLIIGMTEILSSVYINPHVTGFSELMPFILMFIIMMIRPYGLFGQKSIERI